MATNSSTLARRDRAWWAAIYWDRTESDTTEATQQLQQQQQISLASISFMTQS